MIASLGRLFLVLAFGCALATVVSTIAAYRLAEPARERMLGSARHAAIATLLALLAAASALVVLFVGDDFSISYVREHSSRAQPLVYKVAAWWGGQSGSLLLWALMLAGYAVAVGRGKSGSAGSGRILSRSAMAVITGVNLLFIGLIVFAENPFRVIEGAVPHDGLGLNPLLQNYWMQIHPPTLYLGYTGCTVPFAFAVAALLHRRFDSDWVSLVRRWTLFTWLILTIGIMLGGVWAYETLGWGGYWAWDPVENASLMPWLTATAFLHSIMIQARRGMLKNWNMVLVTLTFLLSVFGTFLTRSGVISSIHAFASSGIGNYLLAFLALTMAGAFALIVWRRDDLASGAGFESPLSREGAFLLNNWILLGAAFAVLWGTIFPAVSEAVTGHTVSVGKPYFNQVMVPLGLILLALSGIGPLMAWRRTTPAALLRTLRIPLLLALVAALPLWMLARWQTGAGTAFVLSAFVVSAITLEFVRGSIARRAMTGEALPLSFFNLLMKNRQRYGGYIVHLGIVMMFIGITGSSAFKIEKEPVLLRPGQTLQIGEYTLLFDQLVNPQVLAPEKADEVHAQIRVRRNGIPLLDGQGHELMLYPAVDFFKAVGDDNVDARAGQEPQQARRPVIMSNLANDLYLVLTDFDRKAGTATIKSYLNPLVMWIWMSAGFFIGGTLIAMLPVRRRSRVEAEAPAPASAQSALLSPVTGIIQP